VRHLIIMAISLLLALPSASLAEVVGKLTRVEGRVELLKGGKLPAAAAKVQDGVEPGDVLRTKSLSRAQITFIDNTTVTISPESRIAINEYLFDPGKGKRSAVLELFQGLAQLVVTQVFKVREPDFLVKTQTAVMGVRGTDVGIRLNPNDTTFWDFHGLVRVANISAEVGPAVELTDMQRTVVARGLPPTLPCPITEEDRQLFLRQLEEGPQTLTSLGVLPCPAANLPDAVTPAVTNRVNAIANDLAITPRLPPPLVIPRPAPPPFIITGG
jgi:hypothetical protein